MNAEFFAAVEDIEKEKGIPRGYMYEKIQQAMLAAFRKDNPEYGENVEVILDENKKRIELVINKTVVNEVEDPTAEIDVDSAHQLSKRYSVGDTVAIPVETKKFGRIAAQAAKQVIIPRSASRMPWMMTCLAAWAAMRPNFFVSTGMATVSPTL